MPHCSRSKTGQKYYDPHSLDVHTHNHERPYLYVDTNGRVVTKVGVTDWTILAILGF
jgi:hypothetical protein